MFKRALLLFALCGLRFPSIASADSFDAPLKKKVVDFGPSPYSRAYRIKLSCFVYRAFVVKEYDEGQKGAEWLSIVPVQKGTAPVCAREHAPRERVIESTEWSGYFKGAKGSLVFFYAADGWNGGMPFAVYDSKTGKKLFEDSTYDSKWMLKTLRPSPFDEPYFRISLHGEVFIRYLRVLEAECDLHGEGAPCWEKVRKKLELKGTQMPVCIRYKDFSSPWVSAVAYPVEVSLFPEPVIKPISGPVKCWPVD